jgi:nucleotide-binding universal stress UspA family protein
MSDYQRILTCYDDTAEMKAALHHATSLGKSLRAELHVLVVINIAAMVSSTLGLPSDGAYLNIEDTARETLKRGLDLADERGVSAHGHVAIGNIVDNVRHYAESLRADFVVLGHRRRSGLARLWHGPAPHQTLIGRCGESAVITVTV